MNLTDGLIYFILIAVSIAIVIDIVLLVQGAETLSARIRESASSHPILYVIWGLVVGTLFGHWFW